LGEGSGMPSSNNIEQNKVGEYWAKPLSVSEKKLVAWMEHPKIQGYINSRITGDSAIDWFSYVNKKYITAPVELGLSLGCGEGGLERHGLFLGTVKYFDAIDISAGAIDIARKEALNAGIADRVNYIVSDINQLQLAVEKYDVIFASMSIHHVEKLEPLFDQICNAIRNDGLFICNEYLGPSRFQLSAERLQLINELLSILPKRFRYLIQNGAPTSHIKTSYQNHPLSWFIENDPSEAIRSTEIIDVLKNTFEIVEYRPYGGSILHFLLQDIVGNFKNGEEEDDAWLNILGYFEKALEDRGIITSDFAMVVAKPKHADNQSIYQPFGSTCSGFAQKS
jgi:SAM-dependent methyltransferase